MIKRGISFHEQVRKKHLVIYYDKEVTKCCGIALLPGITILTANRWLNASFNNMRLVRIAIAPFAVVQPGRRGLGLLSGRCIDAAGGDGYASTLHGSHELGCASHLRA